MKEKILAVAGAMFALVLVPEILAVRGGTSILHLMMRAPMTNEGVISNATGKVDLKLNQQGHADNQRLTLTTSKLDSNTVYTLLALLGDDTNLTEVTTFTTGANGAANLKYVRVGSSNGHGNGGHPGGLPLPDTLKPLSNVRALVVENVSTQAVLSADLTAPQSLQYLVRRSLTGTGASADLRIHATTRFVQFRLLASGLQTNAPYFLTLNETNLTSYVSDGQGKLRILGLPAVAPDILDLHDLALQDGNTNTVLSTTLP